MAKEIKASLYHCLKLPPKERHQYCPMNSWCSYRKGLPFTNKPHHLAPVFQKHLDVIYGRLTDPALLARCLPGYTQNANESINALVWMRCPKHKWHGQKRVEMATAAATLHFSSGAQAKHLVMERAEIPPGTHTAKASKRRDSLRVQKAQQRSSDAHKSYRQVRSLARKRDQEMQAQREGTVYLAGGFNDLDLLAAPPKKRRK